MYYRFDWAEIGQRVLVTSLYESICAPTGSNASNINSIQRALVYVALVVEKKEGRIKVFLERALDDIDDTILNYCADREMTIGSRDHIELYEQQPPLEELLTHSTASVRQAAIMAFRTEGTV